MTSHDRSKKETERLRRLNKPVRVAPKDDLPSIDSHDENEGDWSSGFGDDSEDEGLSDATSDGPASASDATSSSSARQTRTKPKRDSADEEMPYEVMPRQRRPSRDPEEKKEKGVERLPIKLSDGRILKSGGKVVLDAEETEESDDESEEEPVPEQKIEDVSTGARFGRPAVLDVIGNKSRKARIQGAKEQIAGICQDIVADPENSVNRFNPASFHDSHSRRLASSDACIHFLCGKSLRPPTQTLYQTMPSSGS